MMLACEAIGGAPAESSLPLSNGGGGNLRGGLLGAPRGRSLDGACSAFRRIREGEPHFLHC